MTCDRCDQQVNELHPCAVCTFALCAICHLLHTTGRMTAAIAGATRTFCDEVDDTARLHRYLRATEETYFQRDWPAGLPTPNLHLPPEPEDFAFARVLYASSLRSHARREPLC